MGFPDLAKWLPDFETLGNGGQTVKECAARIILSAEAIWNGKSECADCKALQAHIDATFQALTLRSDPLWKEIGCNAVEREMAIAMVKQFQNMKKDHNADQA